MTIKEIELLSGMSRANIRYYEAEGLLSPARGSNGYRDYSEEDLRVLQRIRLLRMLRVPLEKIKELHRGEANLPAALEQHISWLEQEKAELTQSQTVCREIRQDRASYRSLDAPKYLDTLERITEEDAPLSEDVLPTALAPWRRYIARGFDYTFYTLLWDLFLILVCNVNVQKTTGFFGTLVPMLMMLFIEPLFLRLFATTPGKWIMGLQVTDNGGDRLTYSAGLSRTLSVLWWGEGAGLPIFQIVRLWKSYATLGDGGTLPWEYDSAQILKDRRRWRNWVIAAAYVLAGIVLLYATTMASLPRYRGDISAREFVRNFNHLAEYLDYDIYEELTSSGGWAPRPNNTFVVYVGGSVEPPSFSLQEEDGVLTEVSFSYQAKNTDQWAPTFQNQMTLAALSFVAAQDDFRPLQGDRAQLIETIEAYPFESFTLTMAGVEIVCEVAYSGYHETLLATSYLIPIEGEENSYSFSFTMRKSK